MGGLQGKLIFSLAKDHNNSPDVLPPRKYVRLERSGYSVGDSIWAVRYDLMSINSALH